MQILVFLEWESPLFPFSIRYDLLGYLAICFSHPFPSKLEAEGPRVSLASGLWFDNPVDRQVRRIVIEALGLFPSV